MTPRGVLRFDLPKVYLTFTTVAVFAEEMRLTVTWQSSLKVPARDAEYLDQTAIGEKPYLA